MTVKHGFKWQPQYNRLAIQIAGQDLAYFGGNGSTPLMLPGKSFFVDPIHGAEANNGLSWDTAVKTITTAYGKCTSDHNDYIFVTGHPYNAFSLNAETYPIDLTKNYVHIIGMDCGAPGLVRTSWNRLNGQACTTGVFKIADTTGGTYGVSLRGEEIAGLSMQNAGYAGISVTGLCYGTYIHDCSFGDWGAVANGIHITGGTAELSNGVIDDCFFAKGITVDGIRTEAASGVISFSFIRNCTFWRVTGVGINYLRASSSADLGGILDCRFFQKTALDKGSAITLVDCYGGMIDGNHAMEDGGHAGNNPFLDTSTGTDTSTTNAWGVNYHGNVVTYPAFS